MEDPTLQKHRGFGTQVDSAAGIMRWYYDHLGDMPWIKRPGQTYTIDGQEISPKSFATGFLYTYTPHIQGNQNFWTLWNRWFAHTYPNGTLIKTAGNPTVYRIREGEKFPFATMAALVTRADPKMIVTVPDVELGRYNTSSTIALPNYSILFDGSTFYLLDDDTVRPFSNESVVRALGFQPDETVDVSPAELALYAIGEPISTTDTAPTGRLIRLKETGQLYYLKDGTIRPVLSDVIAKKNFPTLPIEPGAIADIGAFTLGAAVTLRDGTIFGVPGFPEIYVAEFGRKRHVPDEATFLGLGYTFDQVIWVDELTATMHPTSEPLYLPKSSEPTNEVVPVQSTNALMIRTPKEKTVTTGEVFATDVDAYVVYDIAKKAIVASKNADVVRPLASLTKVITGHALLRENLPLDANTVYSSSLHKATYGTFRVVPGEAIQNTDLFDAMLLSSVNSAAKMLASSATGGEAAFMKRTNTWLDKEGYTKTTIVDPAGIELTNVTTAAEYAKLFAEQTNHPELQRMMSQAGYDYNETLDLDGKPRHYDVHSNALVGDSAIPYTIVASKTGYLDEAGANLAMRVRRPSDGAEFVIVTLGNPNYAGRFTDPDLLTRTILHLP